MSKKYSKLHISISVDDVRDVWVWLVDEKTGEPKLLQQGVNYTLDFVEKQTERCQVCERTYPAIEIVRRGAEQLCLSCDADKYPIRNEDILF